jgi:hypothetical protein
MGLFRLLARTTIGLLFVGHGTQKLFGWFGGGGLEGTAGFFEQLGFRPGRRDELDPDLLIVWMARHVDHQRLPPKRTVVKFDFRGPKRRYWMVLEPSEVSVCLQHPGFDVDLEVIVDTATLYRVYVGRMDLSGAIRAGKLAMSGPRTLQPGLGHWFTWSAFAPASRSAPERRTAASRLASPNRIRIA